MYENNRLFVLTALLLAACGVREAPAQERPAALDPVPVRLVAVERTAVARPVVATGRVAPSDQLRQGFAFGGRVVAVLVDQGDRVKRGQVLARLDVAAIDAQVRQAEAAAAKAERDLARVTGLHADKVVPDETLQNATTGADVARAALDQAREARANAVLRAGADGLVLSRLVEPGEVVGPGAPVVLIGAQGGGPLVKVGLADRDAARVVVGDAAAVRVRTLPDRALAGTVRTIAPMADARTGTIEVEIALAAGAPTLPAGLVAAVEITPSARDDVWLVPMVSLVEADGARASLYTVDARGIAHKRPVQVAFIVGDRVAIRAGLDGVAQVVGDGAGYLDDGAPTRPASEPKAPAKAVRP